MIIVVRLSSLVLLLVFIVVTSFKIDYRGSRGGGSIISSKWAIVNNTISFLPLAK